ncbi:hypothetical protein LTS10_000051 [Elasticomyces elasticus]|nr:hypothetical protein LTS10_000051 [Elasticomyces elasticus]
MDDAEEAAGTRATQVCQACRVRHKKCDWENEACGQCRDNGFECVRQPTFRFRYDPKQAMLSRTPTPSRQWLALPDGPLRFYDETPGIQELYTEGPISVAQSSRSRETYMTPTLDLSPTAHCPARALTTYTSLQGEQTTLQMVSPGQEHGNEPQPFTRSEAILVRNFTNNMAQWTDIADAERTFEFEVSRRALTEPLLRHAICAFSARHYHRRPSEEEEGQEGHAEALDHQNRCLELLIPAMSGGQITESVLAAVAVLRQNEEMDEYDHLFHLEGCSRILNMVPDFAMAGGLGEAAAWLCLREDIYISLTTQSRMNVELDSFLECGWIRRGDDQSWTSRSVLNLAFLLSRAFGDTAEEESLSKSEEEIAIWDRSKPMSYHPIYFKDRSYRHGQYFPEIWTSAPYHAVGLQYYHIARIVLIVVERKRHLKIRPYDLLQEIRTQERQIRHHLLVVIGLAVSNPRAENTWYTARHCLSVWAGCLHRRNDQQAALQFLEDMGRRTGWRVSSLMELLCQKWDNDRESE